MEGSDKPSEFPSETGSVSDEIRRPTWLEGEGMGDRKMGPLPEDTVIEPASYLEGPEDEPPHLERGSPHANEPAPDDTATGTAG